MDSFLFFVCLHSKYFLFLVTCLTVIQLLEYWTLGFVLARMEYTNIVRFSLKLRYIYYGDLRANGIDIQNERMTQVFIVEVLILLSL